MWIQATALVLSCCLWPAEAQRDRSRRQSIWDNPIKFKSKALDQCTMMITGQGEQAKLRVSCEGAKRSYMCEFLGKPHTCSGYNKNPRHYFVQMMWILRKLPNPCQGPRQIKPHMCRKASDESQMVLSAVSYFKTQPGAPYKTATRTSKLPERPRGAPARSSAGRQAVMKPNRPPERVRSTRKPAAQPTTRPDESSAKKMARQYCWRSLHGICSFAIGLFRN